MLLHPSATPRGVDVIDDSNATMTMAMMGLDASYDDQSPEVQTPIPEIRDRFANMTMKTIPRPRWLNKLEFSWPKNASAYSAPIRPPGQVAVIAYGLVRSHSMLEATLTSLETNVLTLFAPSVQLFAHAVCNPPGCDRNHVRRRFQGTVQISRGMNATVAITKSRVLVHRTGRVNRTCAGVSRYLRKQYGNYLEATASLKKAYIMMVRRRNRGPAHHVNSVVLWRIDTELMGPPLYDLLLYKAWTRKRTVFVTARQSGEMVNDRFFFMSTPAMATFMKARDKVLDTHCTYGEHLLLAILDQERLLVSFTQMKLRRLRGDLSSPELDACNILGKRPIREKVHRGWNNRTRKTDFAKWMDNMHILSRELWCRAWKIDIMNGFSNASTKRYVWNRVCQMKPKGCKEFLQRKKKCNAPEPELLEPD